MTVNVETNKVVYTGNGVTTVFPFSFPIEDPAHLLVYEYIIATRAVSLISSANYSVSGIPGTGSVTYNPAGVPVPATKKLVLYRLVPYTQALDLLNQGGFYPDSIEDQLDLLAMQIQQLKEQIARAPKADIVYNDATTAAQDTTLAQTASGFFLQNQGAKINRMQDRTFVGPASIADGAFPAVTIDYLTQLMIDIGARADGFNNAQFMALATGFPCNFGIMGGTQSLGAIAYTVANSGVAFNNSTSPLVDTFAGFSWAVRMAGAGTTLAHEFQITNRGTELSLDPYNYGTVGRTFNITMGCTGSAATTGAMITFRDAQQFMAGWIVGDDAIKASPINSKKQVTKFPGNTWMTWYNGAGVVAGDMGVDLGGNVLLTGAGSFQYNAKIVPTRFSGSATYNPPSLANGASTTTNVTVTNAALGDAAQAAFSLSLQGIAIAASVTAANTVTVTLTNNTGGTLDIANGTLFAWAVRDGN